MTRKTIFIAALGALAAAASVSAAAAQDQTEPSLQVFRSSAYTLAVDDKCQVMNHVTREAVDYLKTTMRGHLATRYAIADLDKEAERVAAVATEGWDGCLDRASHAGEWGYVDHAILYANALIAAPASMPDTVEQCATANGGITVTRAEMETAAAEVTARYEGKASKATLDQVIEVFANSLGPQCVGQGFTRDLTPLATWRTQQKLESDTAAGQKTSIATFGNWTSYRYFAFETTAEYAVSAYRAETGPAAPLLSFRLRTPIATGPSGDVLFRRDGSAIVNVGGIIDALEVRNRGETVAVFERTSVSGEGAFRGASVFELDAASGQALLALPEDASLAFVYQPKDDERWMQYESGYDQAGYLPASRLQAAYAWATAPVAME